MIATPVTVSWEAEPWFMGAFKAQPARPLPLPATALHATSCRTDLDERHRGLFLAGDDISWTAGWAEGAVQTALNAVWGVMHHFGGATHPATRGRATLRRPRPA